MITLKNIAFHPTILQPYSTSITRILQAALDAADPAEAVVKNLSIAKDQLSIGSKTYLLYPDSRILMIAIGKASLEMARGARALLGAYIKEGIIVCKHLPENQEMWADIKIIQGSHPIPDGKSVQAAVEISGLLTGLTSHDLVLLLISGGGSALACLPAQGIRLEDIQTLTSALLKSGASINELNAIRKHLDLIKGGGLLKMASPAQVAALVLSDVVNSPLDVIASGPAVPDPSNFADALAILNQYLDRRQLPDAIVDRFERGVKGEVAETLKPGDPAAAGAFHTLIGSNRISAEAALKTAMAEGFEVKILTNELIGDARLAGEFLARRIIDKKIDRKPYLGIAGGETTVKVKGNGFGGRNLEVALGAVSWLAGHADSLLLTLATDGEDGPTDAAGAFVTGETLSLARQAMLDPEKYLQNNDAYHFFAKAGGLIQTGPTGTNVNDLNFIFKFPDPTHHTQI